LFAFKGGFDFGGVQIEKAGNKQTH
jgi:hypothetical protein